MKRRVEKRWSLLVGGLATAGLLAMPSVSRAADEAPAVNNGAISLSAGIDFTTAYFFRGILQEKHGVIAQPYAEIDGNVYSGDGFIKGASVDFGTWNSIHSKKTGASGTNSGSDLYETDYYGGVSLTLPKNFTLGANYYWLTSPNGAYGTVEELDTTLSYDDSGMWGDGPMGILKNGLQPSATYAVELSGSGHSSGGNGYGKYLQLGIDPSVEVVHSEKYPITLDVPVTVGLSVGNYYANVPNTFGETLTENKTFGYASVGTNFSMPLNFVPKKYGSWSAHVGGTYMWLGNDLGRANGGNNFQAIGTVGISMSY